MRDVDDDDGDEEEEEEGEPFTQRDVTRVRE